MKKIAIVLSFLLLIFACNGTGPEVRDDPVDVEASYFYPKYHNPIAIFPTYKYLGKKNMESEKAAREYNVWKDNRSGKYILITTLTPKGDGFPENVTWINRDSAIYSNGNTTAYTSLHTRPLSVIHELDGGVLPDCIIVAQEFYFNKKEAMFKALIVPDEMCSEVAEPIIEELNRVANMQ